MVQANCNLSWMDLFVRTLACIDYIREKFPIKLPDQVCIVARNSLSLVPWMSATASLGIPTTGVDYTLDRKALHNLVVHLNADLILVSSNTLGGRCDALDFGPFSAKKVDIDSITLVANQPSYKDVAMLDEILIKRLTYKSISITSGTSGLPKSVVRYQSFDNRRFSYFSDKYKFSEKDRFLVSMPLYHAAGNGWARMFMSLGATLFLANISSGSALVDQLVNNRITATVMTPALLSSILNKIESDDVSDYLSIRWLLIGGKQFPTELKKRALGILGDVVYEYYGTTETGVNTLADPNDMRIAPASVGRPFSGNDIQIIGQDGKILAPYNIGTVYVSSYMNMDHYGDGSADLMSINGQKYLKTPDQGYLDSDDRLFLVNRSNTPGNNTKIYSLEDDIRNIPCVADVALLQADNSSVNCAIVTKFAGTNLANMAQSVRNLARNYGVNVDKCISVAELPYTPSGKIRTTALNLLF